ncbi:nucleoporin autopeptidase [Cystoisospora suis]|uniref:Nucleoporin autopeptidase n=1 Tax=Cystoisospora suis TaxID=483139 RepID=A0A2C6LCR5_9APIC|nr:nucleoporin autopeptidase [Cystoisospora suis]
MFSTNTANPLGGGGGLFGSSTGGGLFGGGASSTGTQPQQSGSLFGGSFLSQPQQQQGGSLFGNVTSGGSSLFGQAQTAQPQSTSGGLFGSTSGGGLFGSQPAQQQTGLFGSGVLSSQPQQTTSTGLFGSAGSTPSTLGSASTVGGGLFGQQSGGGLFGSSNTSGGLFGQAKPQGGLFGGTQPTTTSGFGSSTLGSAGQQSSGGLFGQAPQQSGGLFGTTTTAGGGFGSSTTTTGFGSGATPGFGSSSLLGGGTSALSMQQQPFQPHKVDDGLLMTICYGALAEVSQEEERWKFYQQNRIGAGGAGMQTTGGGLFGQQSATTASGGGGLFGSGATGGSGGTSGLFGSSTQPTTGSSLFGGAQQSGGLFGSAGTSTQVGTGTGLFGSNTVQPSQQQQTLGGGLFGNANAGTTNTGGGLLGSSTLGTGNTSTTGLFGTPASTQQQTTGGLFGQQQASQNAGGGLFGSATTQPGTTSGGLFGSTTTGTTGGGLFGSTQPQIGGGVQTTGGLFGGATNTTGQQPGASGGLFGGTTGTSGTGGLFGSTAGTTTGSGLFGTNTQAQQATGGLFGGAKPATGTTPTTGGLFGTTQTGTSTTGSGLFGGSSLGTSTGGLFGTTTTGTKPGEGTTGGGLFGGTTTGTGGLFGNLSSSSSQPSGLLGSTQGAAAGTAGTGLFGSTNTLGTGTGLFGSSTGGLFGSKPAAQQQTQSGGGGLFGSTFGLGGTTPGAAGTGVSALALSGGAGTGGLNLAGAQGLASPGGVTGASDLYGLASLLGGRVELKLTLSARGTEGRDQVAQLLSSRPSLDPCGPSSFLGEVGRGFWRPAPPRYCRGRRLRPAGARGSLYAGFFSGGAGGSSVSFSLPEAYVQRAFSTGRVSPVTEEPLTNGSLFGSSTTKTRQETGDGEMPSSWVARTLRNSAAEALLVQGRRNGEQESEQNSLVPWSSSVAFMRSNPFFRQQIEEAVARPPETIEVPSSSTSSDSTNDEFFGAIPSAAAGLPPSLPAPEPASPDRPVSSLVEELHSEYSSSLPTHGGVGRCRVKEKYPTALNLSAVQTFSLATPESTPGSSPLGGSSAGESSENDEEDDEEDGDDDESSDDDLSSDLPLGGLELLASRARAPMDLRPILTRSDYESSPSVEVLNGMTEGDLSRVQDFSITRRGYGTIRWPGYTDLRGINLDEVVRIEKLEVSVYLDKAPPVGTALNKRAIITLQSCKPKSVQSLETFAALRGGEEEAYVEEKQRQYISKVRRYTERMGAKFLDLNLVTGEWTFEVEHFSTYRFLEDDDDDEDLEKELKTKLQKAAVEGRGEVYTGDDDSEFSEEHSVSEKAFCTSSHGGFEGKEQAIPYKSDDDDVSVRGKTTGFPGRRGKLPESYGQEERKSSWEKATTPLGPEDSSSEDTEEEVDASETSVQCNGLRGGRSCKRVSFYHPPPSASQTDAGLAYAELFGPARKACLGPDGSFSSIDAARISKPRDGEFVNREKIMKGHGLFQGGRTLSGHAGGSSDGERFGHSSSKESLTQETDLRRSDRFPPDSAVNSVYDDVGNGSRDKPCVSSSYVTSPSPLRAEPTVIPRHCPFPVRCAPVISHGGLMALPRSFSFSSSSTASSSSNPSVVQIVRVSPLLHRDLDFSPSDENSRGALRGPPEVLPDPTDSNEKDWNNTTDRKKKATAEGERTGVLWTVGEMFGEIISSSEVEKEELERKALVGAVEDYVLASESGIHGKDHERENFSSRGLLPSSLDNDGRTSFSGKRARKFPLSASLSSLPVPVTDPNKGGVVYAVDTAREQVRIFQDGHGVSRTLCRGSMPKVVTAFLDELAACDMGVTQRQISSDEVHLDPCLERVETGKTRAREREQVGGGNSDVPNWFSTAVKGTAKWWLIEGLIRTGGCSPNSASSSSQNSMRMDSSLGKSMDTEAGCEAVQRLFLRLLAFFERQHRSYCGHTEGMTLPRFTGVLPGSFSGSFPLGYTHCASKDAGLLEASYLAPYMLQTWRLMIALMLEDPQHAAKLGEKVSRISRAFGPRVSAEAILERERQEKIFDWLLEESAKDVRCFFEQAAQRSLLWSCEGDVIGSRKTTMTGMDRGESLFQRAFRTGGEAEEAFQTAVATTDLEERKLLAVFHLAAAGQLVQAVDLLLLPGSAQPYYPHLALCLAAHVQQSFGREFLYWNLLRATTGDYFSPPPGIRRLYHLLTPEQNPPRRQRRLSSTSHFTQARTAISASPAVGEDRLNEKHSAEAGVAECSSSTNSQAEQARHEKSSKDEKGDGDGGESTRISKDTAAAIAKLNDFLNWRQELTATLLFNTASPLDRSGVARRTTDRSTGRQRRKFTEGRKIPMHEEVGEERARLTSGALECIEDNVSNKRKKPIEDGGYADAGKEEEGNADAETDVSENSSSLLDEDASVYQRIRMELIPPPQAPDAPRDLRRALIYLDRSKEESQNKSAHEETCVSLSRRHPVFPAPLYLQQQGRVEAAKKGIHDLQYGLLRMHVGLGSLSSLSLFDPDTHTPYPLDFFFSWTGGLLTALHRSLKKVAQKELGVIDRQEKPGRSTVDVLSQGEAAELHTVCVSFAAELEMVDQWPWACAAVLFSPFTEQALDTARSLILRHAAEFTCCGPLDAATGREVFEERRQEVLSVLLEEIGFPQWWIDEADGLFALSQHKYMQAAFLFHSAYLRLSVSSYRGFLGSQVAAPLRAIISRKWAPSESLACHLLRLAASALFRCLPSFLLAVLLRQIERVQRSKQRKYMRRALEECHRLAGPSPGEVFRGELTSALTGELRGGEEACLGGGEGVEGDERNEFGSWERARPLRMFVLSTEGKMTVFLEIIEAVRLNLGSGYVGEEDGGQEKRGDKEREKGVDVHQQIMKDMALTVEARHPGDVDLVRLARWEHVLRWLLDRERDPNEGHDGSEDKGEGTAQDVTEGGRRSREVTGRTEKAERQKQRTAVLAANAEEELKTIEKKRSRRGTGCSLFSFPSMEELSFWVAVRSVLREEGEAASS